MSRTRAAAIVIRGGHVLLMRRSREADEYWVVPGGGIEPGETAAEACRRELAEETSLIADAVDRVHADGDTDYFLVSGTRGDPRLGDPEAACNSVTNRYELEWVPSGALPLALATRVRPPGDHRSDPVVDGPSRPPQRLTGVVTVHWPSSFSEPSQLQ